MSTSDRNGFSPSPLVIVALSLAVAVCSLLVDGSLNATDVYADSTTLLVIQDVDIGNDGEPNEGTGPDLAVETGDPVRSLAEFDVAAFLAAHPNAVIESATLEMCLLSKDIDRIGPTIHDAHRLLASWTETGATWDSRGPAPWGSPGGDFAGAPTDSASIDVAAPGTFVSWDVTADMLLFQGGTAHNGWLIKDANESEGFADVDYASREFPDPDEDDDEEQVPCDSDANDPRLVILFEDPLLTITKSCPNGAGDGDADFQILVTQLEDAIASDSLDCGEIMVVEGVSGVVRISELITGPNANDFLTAIICTTEAGQTVTPGTMADVDLDSNTECTIINAFQDPADPTTPPAPCDCSAVIVPIDLDNTNDNALNNNNLNDNNNVNTNTQEQSNQQEQTNDNNQTTTVNSSPSVVIDFD